MKYHTPQSQEEQGSPENGLHDVQKMYANDTDLSNTDLKDLDTIDTRSDFSQNNHLFKNSMTQTARFYHLTSIVNPLIFQISLLLKGKQPL